MLKKINSHNAHLRVKKHNNLILCFLGIVSVLLYALFFPAYESPDEITHLERILKQSNLWGLILNNLSSFFLDLKNLNVLDQLKINENFSFARNEFLYLTSSAPIEYYFVRIINALIVLALFFLFVLVFNGNKFSILWPSATYYLSILNSEGIAYALMLGSSTNTKTKIFFLIFLSLILFFVDRSIATFVAFLLIKFALLSISKGNLLLFKQMSIGIFFASIIIYSISIFEFELIFDFILSSHLREIMFFSQNLKPDHLNQLVIFVASSLALTGYMSFYPTIIFYLLFIFLIYHSLQFVKSIKVEQNEINEILGTIFVGLSVFLLVSSLAPQLAHFRYYLFLAPSLTSIFLYRYPVKYLAILTLIVLIYNTLILNLYLI